MSQNKGAQNLYFSIFFWSTKKAQGTKLHLEFSKEKRETFCEAVISRKVAPADDLQSCDLDKVKIFFFLRGKREVTVTDKFCLL